LSAANLPSTFSTKSKFIELAAWSQIQALRRGVYLGTTSSLALEPFVRISGVSEPPITRRRLHTFARKTLLSYYTEEERAKIVRAAKKLRMSISNFIASAALKEAEVVNSKTRDSH